MNLDKDGGILNKDSFGASHPLCHGSLCNSKGLGCNVKLRTVTLMARKS